MFPNACFAWVKDADHLLHIEKPNEFNGTIINFLESWFGTKKKKKDENKNSMTNLQHFFWLLQYRLAILTSPKICVKWLFRIYPRNSLHSLFCFVKHSNKRHISDFKNCCGLFWVSIFAVFISFYQGIIEALLFLVLAAKV